MHTLQNSQWFIIFTSCDFGTPTCSDTRRSQTGASKEESEEKFPVF
jgi:hypothetical protein